MLERPFARPLGQRFRGRVYQGCAAAVCLLLGMAMIINTQWGGEAMWFWYANAFHSGAKLYSGLHTPLQPVFILETDAWMRLFGIRCLPMELLSVVHLAVLCMGIFLVLRESDWPDWQKAFVFVGAFALFATGQSYRFDDYHVVAECLILYSLVVLLWLARAEAGSRQLRLTVIVGTLSGLTVTTRLTDGAALFVVGGLSLLILLRRRRLPGLALFVAAAAAIALLMIKLTGDSVADYISNTIIKAAGSKGGTGSIFAAPFVVVRNTLALVASRKRVILWVLAVAVIGAGVQVRWRWPARSIVLLQMSLAGLTFALCGREMRELLLQGQFLSTAVLVLILTTYLLTPIIVGRFLLAASRAPTSLRWDVREVLGILPLAIWASYAAGAGGEPFTQYYAPFGMLLLLVPVLQPFQRSPDWFNPAFVTTVALIGLSGITSKILLPYSWQNYRYSAMFVNRQWYRHPVYGPLYIDKDLLNFSVSVCKDLGQTESGKGPALELLSLPYPYPNYCCATPPWKGYVQTFFDTSTRATIDQLAGRLATAPPQWIVYQRQLVGLAGSERLYNHGKPWPQRELDEMIMRKIASGDWVLVDKKMYLKGDGWFIIRTRS